MGYLKIILGCMFSGKTSKLITIYKKNVIAEIPTCIINYVDDTRYDAEKMSTHDGVKVKCIRAKSLMYIFKNDPKLIVDNKVFIINEGQFFSDLYETVSWLVGVKDKDVYVGGLDGDYKMKKFGSILDLIPLCNEIEKLNAVCASCKGDASFTKRITNHNHEQVLIGGSDIYIPVCRNCH
tara:strand:- start:9632 stop:10171 length:540 start_codon:yes stop_codon:yes gene_type:complete